jgi:hypothetical protein
MKVVLVLNFAISIGSLEQSSTSYVSTSFNSDMQTDYNNISGDYLNCLLDVQYRRLIEPVQTKQYDARSVASLNIFLFFDFCSSI